MACFQWAGGDAGDALWSALERACAVWPPSDLLGRHFLASVRGARDVGAGRLGSAVGWMREAAALSMEAGALRHTANVRNDLANVLHQVGLLAEAEAEFRAAWSEATSLGMEAQAAQLIGDRRLGDRFWITSGEGSEMAAQIGRAEAFCELSEQDDGMPQRVDARIGKAQT